MDKKRKIQFRVRFYLSLPRTSIIRSTHNWILKQQVFVSVMDRKVGFMNCCDEVVWVKKQFAPIPDILWPDRVHVMNDNPTKYLPAWDGEIASLISGNDKVSYPPPFRGAIKELVHIPIKSKSLFANFSIKAKILIPFSKCRKKYQFGITFNIRHRTLPHRR